MDIPESITVRVMLAKYWQLTDELDAAFLEKMRIVLAHVPSRNFYELGNMLDTYYASVRAYHVCHAG